MCFKNFSSVAVAFMTFIFFSTASSQSSAPKVPAMQEPQKNQSVAVPTAATPLTESKGESATPSPTAVVAPVAKVFSIEDELALERTPEAKIAKLDFLLEKQASVKLSDMLSQDNLTVAAGERKKLCDQMPGRCVDVRPWVGLICRGDVNNFWLNDLFWTPVVTATRNDITAKSWFHQIQSRCPTPSLGKLSLVLKAMEAIAIQITWATARSEAQTLFEKEFVQKPADLTAAFQIVSPSIEKMRSQSPMSLDLLRIVGRTAAGWLKGAKLGDVDSVEALNFFGQIGVIAREGMLKPYAEAYLSATSIAPLQFDGIVMMEVICYYLTISGQHSRCVAEVEKLKNKNTAAQNSSVEMLLLQAKVHAFAGDLQAQYKIITGLLTKKDTLNKNILPWIYFDLAHVEMDLGWLEAANTHIQEHQRLVNASNAPHFVKQIGYSLLVSISAVSANKESWQYVLRQAPFIRQQMEKSVVGVTETYAFLALDKIIASAFLRNGEVPKHLAELEAIVKELKYQDDIAELGRIIAAASKGQFDPNAFVHLRKKVGAKYPRLMRAEKVVARLKAQKS